MRRQLVLAGLGLLLLALGAWRSTGPPRLTLLNAGVRVDYPWSPALACLAAAAGLGLLGLAPRRRLLRWIAAAAALAALAAAGSRAAYRVDADEAGIHGRGLLGATQLAWKDLRRVDAGPELILLWGPGDSQVRIDTSGFRADQRATLERTIARWVREARQGE